MSFLDTMMTEEEFLQHMATLTDDELEHYGVKGMKWGVIRDRAAAGDKRAQKKLAKADIAWEKSSHGTSAYVEVHNKMARAMNGEVMDKFNANPKYKKIKDFGNFDDPKVKEYHSDFDKLSSKYFAEAIKDTYGESPSGRYSAEVKKSSDGYYYAEMVDHQAEVKHADVVRYRFELKTDNGKILSVGDPIEDEIKHDGMLSKDEFLEHFGVKGMKWGKRKDSSSSNVHRSADAARYRKIEDRAKKKGLDNLSNDDLAKLNKRQQLLAEYAKNNPSKAKKAANGYKTTASVLKTVGSLVVVAGAIAGVTAAATKSEGALAIAKALKGL